jgi:pantetheine-phosphate adenylyltransferase
MSAAPSIAIYTGSFDPFHCGHEDIVRRAARLFDRIVVGVGINPEKQELFTAAERVEMISKVMHDLPKVTVRSFSDLTVRFAREQNATTLLRGIRALSDIEYEFTMSLTNASLDPELETVFLMAKREFSHLSSSLIRQIARFGGELHGFVPEAVRYYLQKRFAPQINEAPKK